jgi:hypothetical protein
VKAKGDANVFNTLVSNFTQIAGTELPNLARSIVTVVLQGVNIEQEGHIWPYWITGAEGIMLPVAVEITPAFGNIVGDIINSMIAGNPLFTSESGGSVTSVDVTAINKLLRNITLLDSNTIEN